MADLMADQSCGARVAIRCAKCARAINRQAICWPIKPRGGVERFQCEWCRSRNYAQKDVTPWTRLLERVHERVGQGLPVALTNGDSAALLAFASAVDLQAATRHGPPEAWTNYRNQTDGQLHGGDEVIAYLADSIKHGFAATLSTDLILETINELESRWSAE